MSINTGYKQFNTLVQVYEDTGAPTGVTKSNVQSDPDYIAPIQDPSTCPAPETTSTTSYLDLTILNNSSESIQLTNLSIKDNGVDTIWYQVASTGLIPSASLNDTDNAQTTEQSRVAFNVSALSKNIAVTALIQYREAGGTSYATIGQVKQLQVNGTANILVTTPINVGNNSLKITFTDDPIIVTTHTAPIVNAGADQSINPGATNLIGTIQRTNTDGSISSTQWSLVSGPNTPTFSSPNALSCSVSGLIVGTYTFQLSATNNYALTGVDTVQVVVTPVYNSNGILNVYVDESMPDTTFQITSIKLLTNWAGSNILTTPINKTSGVKLLTPIKGTYALEITVSGNTANNKSLRVSWNNGANVVTFNVPQAGAYIINNVVVDEGSKGVLINFNSYASGAITETITFGKLTLGDTQTINQNTLPFGKTITTAGDVTVAFYGDNVATSGVAFTGSAIVKKTTVDVINNVTTSIFLTIGFNGASSKVVGSTREVQVYDYTLNDPNSEEANDLVSHFQYSYQLIQAEGYIVIS